MKKLFLLLLAGCLWSLAADAQPVIEKQGSKKEPFTFVQIADPQLGFCDKGQDWRWTVDNLKATVARVNELKPAFVIVTGDLIHNHKNAEQARAYRENIALIDALIPVFHIPGNHDIPDYGAEALAQYLDEFGYDRFSFSYNGSAFIGLNSNAMVCDSERAAADARAQLEWFGKQLERYRKCNHIFVFTHHPLVLSPDSRVTHKSAYDEPFRTEYAALMKRYGGSSPTILPMGISGCTDGGSGAVVRSAGRKRHRGVRAISNAPMPFFVRFSLRRVAECSSRGCR